MRPVPWRYVESWSCVACGVCCRGYNVVLTFQEWMSIVRDYGISATEPGLNKFYLKRRDDDTCVFLSNYYTKWVCGLQHMKPLACKLWPFKILDAPRFGSPGEASYSYGGKRLFIYVDPLCVGIRWGKPTHEFMHETLSEFVEIALGLRTKQSYSTGKLQ